MSLNILDASVVADIYLTSWITKPFSLSQCHTLPSQEISNFVGVSEIDESLIVQISLG